MIKKLLILVCILPVSFYSLLSQPRNVDTRDFAVLLSAKASKNPDKIVLKWSNNELANQYRIFRKSLNDPIWSNGLIATLDSVTTEFTDTNIKPGIIYEYEVQAFSYGTSNGAQFNFWGFGYIATGLEVPEYDNPGKVILMIDTTLIDKLKTEIARLKKDLRAEGWGIIEKYVPRSEKFDGNAVKKNKSVIMDEYLLDRDNVKAVYILGRVAVPYSGNFNPDAHPDHQGAWPADIYYGYMNSESNWTDYTINNSVANRQENKNIPGDGKFDQSIITSDNAALYVGRVDLYGMKQFHAGLNDPEVDLLRKYLGKNHRYRNGDVDYSNSGIIDDNFGASSYIEGFASSGWRNIAVLTAPDQVRKADFFTTLSTESHLMSYGCGGGSYTSAGGIGTTADFAAKPVNSVFTILFGSYFGDWDIENNFLRAPLASDPMALTSSWVARPHWYFHHMGLGFPIGYSTLKSHNNLDLYKPNVVFTSQYPNGVIYAVGMKQVHTALMGDPTLKLHPAAVPAPSSVSTFQTKDKEEKPVVRIIWKGPDLNIEHSYNVYRSKEEFGLYTKINTTPIKSEEFFDDLSGSDFNRFDGQVYYMVRTVMLDQNNSGSFFNISRGTVSNLMVTDVKDNPVLETKMSINPNPAINNINIDVNLNYSGYSKLQVIDINGNVVATIFDGFLNSGNHSANWDLTNSSKLKVASGVYLLRLVSSKEVIVKQISIVK